MFVDVHRMWHLLVATTSTPVMCGSCTTTPHGARRAGEVGMTFVE